MDCSTCKHGIFCPTWGEWKCTFDSRRFIKLEDYEDFKCPNHSACSAKEALKRECHCDDCQKNSALSDEF